MHSHCSAWAIISLFNWFGTRHNKHAFVPTAFSLRIIVSDHHQRNAIVDMLSHNAL